jgi:ATP-dependent Clp protease ATP-binding subunit ClpA
VDQRLKKPLAEALLFGALKDGGTARFDVKGEGLELTALPARVPEPA